MNLLEELKNNNTITNSKGGEYFSTTYDANLDLFTKINRFNDYHEVIDTFTKAYIENRDLALANTLYLLDIREGKGERRLFKIIFKYLCNNHKEDALVILPFISKLGRWDYILEGINTTIENEVVVLIKEQLELDNNSDNVSLLGKWLPSLRCHNKNNLVAKRLVKLLGMSEKEYRKLVKELRTKINIVESNITNKNYDNIDFYEVPTKALLKYEDTFNRNIKGRFEEFKNSVSNGEGKINTKGLFCYEIIKKLIFNCNGDLKLYDLMWKNQKDISLPNDNILVVADTSGSMTYPNYLPISTSIGLAIYIAERNKGIFKNNFITFSNNPVIQEIKGNTIDEKILSLREINALNTDIDKTFELILRVLENNNVDMCEVPKHILIISDMEFDKGVYSETGTNFNGWKKAFDDAGYQLPNIIFWNVAGTSNGVPVTKFEDGVSMISGFSTNILENLFDLENYNPITLMVDKLNKYLDMIKVGD